MLTEVAIGGKGSEITTAPKVLEGLDLHNMWVMSGFTYTKKLLENIQITIIHAHMLNYLQKAVQPVWFAETSEKEIKSILLV